jgi:hypothetical protein
MTTTAARPAAAHIRRREAMRISREVHKALGVLLEEFGSCGLGPRFEHFRYDSDELEAAFGLVHEWWANHADTPSDGDGWRRGLDSWPGSRSSPANPFPVPKTKGREPVPSVRRSECYVGERRHALGCFHGGPVAWD